MPNKEKRKMILAVILITVFIAGDPINPRSQSSAVHAGN